MTYNDDRSLMDVALEEASKSLKNNEVPIGCVIWDGSQILARAHNLREQSRNPLDHAEIIVLHEASQKIENWRLNHLTLYVTLEPCPMCLGALLQARIHRLVYGCRDLKRPLWDQWSPQEDILEIPSLEGIALMRGNNHKLAITGGVLSEKCSRLLKDYFAILR